MSDVAIEALPPQGMVTLRGAFGDLGPVVTKVTGCDMPEMRMSTSNGTFGVLWMSPDELLITCPYEEAPALAAELVEGLGDSFATVAVVSDARAVFAIGAGGERVLAHLCPADLAALAPTEVRRTRLAQVPAAFWRDGDGWRLVCFRSVARYAEGLLRNAAA